MKVKPGLVHLSDLQFGNKNRYKENSPEEIGKRLVDDLTTLTSRHEFAISGIIVTGDIAETASPREYEIATSFFKFLKNNLNLGHKDFIFVPGNHDINWSLCQAARLRAITYSESFEEPFFEKFEPFKKFYDEWFSNEELLFTKDLFSIHINDNSSSVILALNSCVKESEEDKDHYGFIGINQLKKAVDKLHRLSDRDMIKIIAFHHNYLCRSNLDNENLRDSDELSEIINNAGIDLILHGHRHIAGIEQIVNPLTQQKLTIIGAGSAGLDHDYLPDNPNQYGIILFEKDTHKKCKLIMRQFSAQTYGMEGKGKWVADTSVSEDGIVDFYLSNIQFANFAETSQSKETELNVIGRKNELKLLSELYNQIFISGPKFMLIEGDLGIGKTTLIAAFFEKHLGKVIKAEKRCSEASYNKNLESYLKPIRDITIELLQNINYNKDIFRKIEEVLKDAGLNNSNIKIITPHLLSNNKLNLDSEAQKSKIAIFQAYSDLLKCLAEKSPTLILIDDIQWADSDTLDFLHFLCENFEKENLPILITLNFRPEGRIYNSALRKFLALLLRHTHDLVYYHLLPPLSDDELVEIILGIDNNLKKHANKIAQKANGNAFIAIELAKHLLIQNNFDEELLNSEDIPSSLKRIFENRLIQLKEYTGGNEYAELLFLIHALENKTSFNELESLVSNKIKINFNIFISELIDLGLIQEKKQEQNILQLANRLIEEIVPDCVPKEFPIQTNIIYKNICEAIENGIITGKSISFQANSYYKSGNYYKATEKYIECAQEYINVGNSTQSLNYLSYAKNSIQKIKDPNEFVSLKPKINLLKAKCFDHTNNYEKADEQIDNILEETEIESNLNREAYLLKGLIYTRKGQWKSAQNIFKELEKNDYKDNISCYSKLYNAISEYTNCIDINNAIDKLKKILSADNIILGKELRVKALTHLSIFSLEINSVNKAKHYLLLTQREMRNFSNVIDKELLKNTEASIYLIQSDIEGALETYLNSYKNLMKLGYKFGAATAMLNAGMCTYLTDNINLGIDRCRNAEELFTELALDHGAAQALLGVALGYLLLKDWNEAYETTEIAVDIMEIAHVKDIRDIATANIIYGASKLAQDELMEAQTHFKNAKHLLETSKEAGRLKFINEIIMQTTIIETEEHDRNYQSFIKTPYLNIDYSSNKIQNQKKSLKIPIRMKPIA